MFSLVQNTLSYIAWQPFRLAGAIVSPITLMMEYQNFSSPQTVLQQCLTRLERIEALINGISVERQRKIETAARRGLCNHLRDVQFELERLFEEYYTLCRLYKESTFHGRFPGTILHRYILDFEEDIMRFFRDIWRTTHTGDRSIDWREVFKMNIDPKALQTSN